MTLYYVRSNPTAAEFYGVLVVGLLCFISDTLDVEIILCTMHYRIFFHSISVLRCIRFR